MRGILWIVLLLAIALAGLITIAVNITSLIAAKKRENSLDKKQVRRSMAVLCAGAVIAAGPLLYIGVVRSMNASLYGDYVDTGHRAQYTSFSLDNGVQLNGIYYADDYYADLRSILYDTEMAEGFLPMENAAVFGEPLANLEPSENDLQIVHHILGHKNTALLYPVENAAVSGLVSDGENSLYCRVDQLDAAVAYYTDLSNYNYFLKGDDLVPMDESMCKKLGNYGLALPEKDIVSDSPTATEHSVFVCLISQDGLMKNNQSELLKTQYGVYLILSSTVTMHGEQPSYETVLRPLPEELAAYFGSFLS